MKIGILFNCQHESLAIALRALLPSAQVISFELATAQFDESQRSRIETALAGCDHVVTQDVASGYGPLGTAVLRARVRRLHLLPAFRFAGFHPDSVSLTLDGVNLGGPTGGYHSRIAVAGYLAGLSPRATADLFNRLSFARLGYLHRFAEQHALLLENYALYRIDLSAPFKAWMQDGCFMHSVNHPRMRVMVDLARAVCAMAGLPVQAEPPGEADLPDPLAPHPTHPVFPDIAAVLDIAPSGAFRNAAPPGGRARVMGTEAFVTGSHAVFRRTPRSVLRSVDGVQAALAALGLAEAHAAPRPMRPHEPADAAFLTWHGTVLAVDGASAMLVQRDMLASDEDATDLRAALPPLPLAAPFAAAAMAGAIVAPATRAGTVCIQRGGKYLCAEQGHLAVRYNRDRAEAWEVFLPRHPTALEDVRLLLAGHWRTASGTSVPSAAIRMLEGFVLAIGEWRLDLCQQWPRRDTSPDGSERISFEAGGATIILVPDQAAPGASWRLLRDTPEYARPVEIGSAEEFRLTRSARLKLQGPAELFHAPLVASDADRAWLHGRYFDSGALPGVGRHFFHAAALRSPNKTLMLGRSVEGVLFDRQGVVKDMGFLIKPTRMPPQLRSLGNDRLLNTAEAAKAALIDGPVCVFYNPNLQNYYHWVVESLLALHVLAPHLPPGTRLVLPGTLADFRRNGAAGFDHASFLPALGFGQFATIEVAAPFVKLADAIWLESDSVFGMPAIMLQSFRARAAAMCPPPVGGSAAGPRRRRLYIKRGAVRRVANTDMLEAFLKPHGFETLLLENMPAQAQIAAFTNAEWVIAPHGAGMANMVFCPAGTRIMELSPDCEYRPYFWLFAEKLNLPYGVLPCATPGGGFNGDFVVDMRRFAALFAMLQAVLP
jgi:hypothetical protein